MKQVELVSIKKFQEQEVPVPEIKNNQVLVEVNFCGICGSDIHSYTGSHPFVHPPIVLGHEYSGIIKKKGDNVLDLHVGDLVTSEIVVNCGECYACKHGRYQICEKGKYLGNIGINGAMSDYLIMDADKVYKLPENMTAKQGAMVEPAAVGIHATRKSNFRVGDIALVIGAGVIGNLTAQALKIAGARRVIVIDLIEARIKKAKELGFKDALNTGKVDLKKWINENIGSNNLDIIFDCVGTEQSINIAINNAREGSQIIDIGVPPLTVPVNLARMQDREINIMGSCQYVRDDYIRTIDLISQGVINTDILITNIYSFSDYQKAYDVALSKDEAEKGCMKVMMEY